MTHPHIDTLEMAKLELAEAMVPTPEDLLGDVGPLAQLYYTERLLYVLLGMWTGMIAEDTTSGLDADSPPVKAQQAIALAAGNIDAACILLDILPAAAAFGG